MKKKFWASLTIFMSGVGAGLIPFCHALANEMRYENGWGSEAFLPLLPVLIYFFAKQIKETWSEVNADE